MLTAREADREKLLAVSAGTFKSALSKGGAGSRLQRVKEKWEGRKERTWVLSGDKKKTRQKLERETCLWKTFVISGFAGLA